MNPANNISPIDVAGIVNAMMMKEQIPMDRIKRDEKSQNVQLNQYASLKSLLQTFGTNLQALTNTFNAIGFQVASSDSNAITAQITGNNIAPIPHSLSVSQLAQAASQISNSFSDGTTALGIADSVSMTIGSNSFSVTTKTTDSLQNIRDNINNAAQAAGLGVSASILSTSNGAQLIIASTQTGVVNGVSVGDSSGSFNFSQQTQALDAQFKFDTQSVTNASNNISNVIDGLNIQLLTTTTSDVSLTVNHIDPTTQSTNVTTSVQNFLTAYNQVMSYIDQVQANPKTANETFPLLKLSLQEALGNTIASNSVFHSLNDIGIVTQPALQQTTTVTTTDQNGKEMQKEIHYMSTGQLQLNTDSLLPTLGSALQSNFSAVQNLLTNGQHGLLTAVSAMNDPLIGSVSISMNTNVNRLNQLIQTDKQKISDQEEKLAKIQLYLTQKYARLNVTLQKMQETNDYLAKQLENINRETQMGLGG